MGQGSTMSTSSGSRSKQQSGRQQWFYERMHVVAHTIRACSGCAPCLVPRRNLVAIPEPAPTTAAGSTSSKDAARRIQSGLLERLLGDNVMDLLLLLAQHSQQVRCWNGGWGWIGGAKQEGGPAAPAAHAALQQCATHGSTANASPCLPCLLCSAPSRMRPPCWWRSLCTCSQKWSPSSFWMLPGFWRRRRQPASGRMQPGRRQPSIRSRRAGGRGAGRRWRRQPTLRTCCRACLRCLRCGRSRRCTSHLWLGTWRKAPPPATPTQVHRSAVLPQPASEHFACLLGGYPAKTCSQCCPHRAAFSAATTLS